MPKSDDWNPKRIGKEGRHWKFLRTTEKGAHERRKATRRFNRAFRRGHSTSIRRFVGGCARQAAQGKPFGNLWWHGALPDIHPDAFEILRKYGKHYRPRIWEKPPPWGEPKRAACYLNSLLLVHADGEYLKKQKKRKTQMSYVEGIAMGVYVRPMLHAWNSVGLNSRCAIDWTHFAACGWTRYLGIALTKEENTELRSLTKLGTSVHLIMHRDYFTPAAKKRLIEILENRRKKKKSRR